MAGTLGGIILQNETGYLSSPNYFRYTFDPGNYNPAKGFWFGQRFWRGHGILQDQKGS